MLAPDFEVQLSTKQHIHLAELYKERPLCVVFLRHIGCIFCREYVARLRKLVDSNIAFVTADTPANTDELRLEMGSPHRFICDIDRHLHALFGVGLASSGQLVHPGVVFNGTKALVGGFRQKPSGGDKMQMPGVFVIGTDGKVIWSHKPRHIADNPSPEEIVEHLKAGRQGA